MLMRSAGLKADSGAKQGNGWRLLEEVTPIEPTLSTDSGHGAGKPGSGR